MATEAAASATAMSSSSSSTAPSTSWPGALDQPLPSEGDATIVGEPTQRGSGILDAVKFLSSSARRPSHLHVLSQGACVALMEAYDTSVSDEKSGKLDTGAPEKALSDLLDKYSEFTQEAVDEYRNERDRERGVVRSSESSTKKRPARSSGGGGGVEEVTRKRKKMRSDDESSSVTAASTTGDAQRRAAAGRRHSIALLGPADDDSREDDADEHRKKGHHNKSGAKVKVKKKGPTSFKVTDAAQVTRKLVKSMKAECLTVSDRQKALRSIFMGPSPELREAAIANFTSHKGLELMGTWMKEVNKDKSPEVGPMLVYLGCLDRVLMTVDLLRSTSIGKVVTASVKAFTGRSEMVVTNGRRLIEKWKKIACSSGVSPGRPKPPQSTTPSLPRPPRPATPPSTSETFKPVIAAKSSAPPKSLHMPVVASKSIAPVPAQPTTNSLPLPDVTAKPPSPPPSKTDVEAPPAVASKSPSPPLTLPVGRKPAGTDDSVGSPQTGSSDIRGSPMNSPHFSPPPAAQRGPESSLGTSNKDSDADPSRGSSTGRRGSTDDLDGLMDLMSPGGKDDDDGKEALVNDVTMTIGGGEEEASFGAVPTNIDDDMADIMGLMDLPGTNPGDFEEDEMTGPAGSQGNALGGASAGEDGGGASGKQRLMWKKDEELVNMVVFVKNEPLWDTVKAINDARGTHVTYVEHGHTTKFMEQRKKEDAMGGTQLRHQYGHFGSAPAATATSPSRGKRSAASTLLAGLGASSPLLDDAALNSGTDNIAEDVIWLEQLPMVLLPGDCTRIIGQLKSYERQDLADLHGGRAEVFYPPEAGVRVPDSPAEPNPGRSVFLMAPDALENETVEVKLKVKDGKGRKKAVAATPASPRVEQDTGVVVLDDGPEGSPGGLQRPPAVTEASPSSSDDSGSVVQQEQQRNQILAALISASAGGPVADDIKATVPPGSVTGGDEVRFESEFVKLDPALQEAIIKSEQFLKLFQEQPWLMINLTMDSLSRIGEMMELYKEKAKEEAEEEARRKQREVEVQAQQAQMAAEMQAKLGHSPSPGDEIASSAAESSPSRSGEGYEKRGWGVTSILTSLKEQVRTHVRSEVAAASHSTPAAAAAAAAAAGWFGNYGRGGKWYPKVGGKGGGKGHHTGGPPSSTGYSEGSQWQGASGGQGWAGSGQQDSSYHVSEPSTSSPGSTGYAEAGLRYGSSSSSTDGVGSYNERYTSGKGAGGHHSGGGYGTTVSEGFGKGGKGYGKGSGGYKGGGKGHHTEGAPWLGPNSGGQGWASSGQQDNSYHHVSEPSTSSSGSTEAGLRQYGSSTERVGAYNERYVGAKGAGKGGKGEGKGGSGGYKGGGYGKGWAGGYQGNSAQGWSSNKRQQHWPQSAGDNTRPKKHARTSGYSSWK
ncbi:hypothetical protein FOL46_007969 [Perkinsus olseni]|uniref:TFIIS N-terminal domain-containing protein n=1 Tax=Perkinsus olseni TaxID=32597 RepID=A0A7J6MN46_PEROL|nr:hypothetical protein FOL46_007969 [Perkinsus olseni]